MTSKNDFFEFTKSGKILAFIQAKSEKQARQRTQLVSHIVRIPEECQVRRIRNGTPCRAPIFFEKHLRAIENMIEEGLAEA